MLKGAGLIVFLMVTFTVALFLVAAVLFIVSLFRRLRYGEDMLPDYIFYPLGISLLIFAIAMVVSIALSMPYL